MTFQHFMREEIQDASQLPPSFDIFEAFAKVSVKCLISLLMQGNVNATLYFLFCCWSMKIQDPSYLKSLFYINSEGKRECTAYVERSITTSSVLSILLLMARLCSLSVCKAPFHTLTIVLAFLQRKQPVLLFLTNGLLRLPFQCSFSDGSWFLKWKIYWNPFLDYVITK